MPIPFSPFGDDRSVIPVSAIHQTRVDIYRRGSHVIRWIRRSRNADEGTIMVLVLGLVPVVAGLIAVGTDAAVLFSHRRALVSHADAAALAAAQSADLGTLYTARKIESLPLDCRTARSVVTADRAGLRGFTRDRTTVGRFRLQPQRSQGETPVEGAVAICQALRN